MSAKLIKKVYICESADKSGKMKLQTPVEVKAGQVTFSPSDKIMVLGSCFADNIGQKMKNIGMDAMVNPFGTLYNPASISYAVDRLKSGTPFSASECRMMGSGAGMVCSFSHHTSFARKSEEEFLAHANAVLSDASDFFRSCSLLIITLGTSWCYKHVADDRIVSNCLKRDAKEFIRLRLGVEDSAALIEQAISLAGNEDVPPENFREKREVSFYARELCVSTKHLARVVKSCTGKTPHAVIDAEVLGLAIQLLKNEDMLVQQVADHLHFSDQAAFSKFFRKYMRMSPTEYRRNAD